jgi:tRNA-splicing ligase RtcB
MKQSNYEVIQSDNGGQIKAWTINVPVEEAALTQLKNVASFPFIYKWISAMPDIHVGAGSTIGSVIPTTNAIIPAAVGMDIGCGMMAVLTSIKKDQFQKDLWMIRSEIERAVPHGRTDNGGKNDRGAWGKIPDAPNYVWEELLLPKFKEIVNKYPKLEKANHVNHLGTLGTGNHFIEICFDEEDRIWIVVHSGSRGIGGQIGKTFINFAKEECKAWYINLPDPNLAYLSETSRYFNDYIEAAMWAQEYASLNRKLIINSVIECLKTFVYFGVISELNCHHNYVAMEHHFGKNVYVTRKGAIRAREKDYGIIPGSMGAKSYIVRGKGNKESFDSCSHGAGRAMSRTEALKRFTVEDHMAATNGIECRKDNDVIDETPMAYKSIDDVMEAQKDLVEIVHTLKQIICVKG